jgi:hypothetical protein
METLVNTLIFPLILVEASHKRMLKRWPKSNGGNFVDSPSLLHAELVLQLWPLPSALLSTLSSFRSRCRRPRSLQYTVISTPEIGCCYLAKLATPHCITITMTHTIGKDYRYLFLTSNYCAKPKASANKKWSN